MKRSRLADFRLHKDEYFLDGANSPLDPDDQALFKGLDYFPENPDLAFAVEIDTNAPGTSDVVQLDTSDGLVVDFSRAGTVTFSAGTVEITLTVLKDLDRGRYFLPFRDKTSGNETYELGRYLDPQMSPDGHLMIDFNYAYSPYCAYGEGWSCPFPPRENWIELPIEAGEKKFMLEGNGEMGNGKS